METTTRKRLDAIITDREAHAARVRAHLAELRAIRARRSIRSLTLSGVIRRVKP